MEYEENANLPNRIVLDGCIQQAVLKLFLYSADTHRD